jgi:hypothetical protein
MGTLLIDLIPKLLPPTFLISKMLQPNRCRGRTCTCPQGNQMRNIMPKISLSILFSTTSTKPRTGIHRRKREYNAAYFINLPKLIFQRTKVS